VAHVTRPAFKDANILEVAATEDDETPETTEAAAEENQEGTTMENENPEVEAAEVEAVTPVVQAAAPIRTAPRSPIVDSASYLEHTIKAAMGNDDSRQYVRAADESTATNTGLTLAPHLTEFISDTIFGRPTIDAISGGVLPANGMSFTLPRLTQAPSVSEVGEEDNTFGTPMTSDFITVNVAKYAGASIVSYELIDRSSPAFLTELLRELSSAYAKATNNAVADELIVNGTAATAVANTASGLQSFIATESAAAYAGSGNFARNLIANTDNWAAIMGFQDDADRPLYMAAAPQNSPGQVSGTSIVGNVLGTSLYVDPHMGLGRDERMLLVAPEAATWYESPVRQVRAEAIGTGQIEISLYGYGAIALKKPLGIRVYHQS
jgi:HK97 family phage major capsid protein